MCDEAEVAGRLPEKAVRFLSRISITDLFPEITILFHKEQITVLRVRIVHIDTGSDALFMHPSLFFVVIIVKL